MQQEFTVFCRGEQVRFTSSMLDSEAVDKLRTLVSSGKLTSNFAKDMAKLSAGTASPRQLPWIHKLVLDYEASQSDPQVQQAKEYNFIKIVALLEFARREGKIKNPILRIHRGDVHIRLSFAGPTSRHPGTINITSEDRSRWYGRIYRNGTYEPRNLSADILEALAEVAKDPLEAARLYGRRTGRCCFCGRHLDNANSIELGYGPICAEKWGLFHSYAKGDVEITTPTPSEIMDAARQQ